MTNLYKDICVRMLVSMWKPGFALASCKTIKWHFQFHCDFVLEENSLTLRSILILIELNILKQCSSAAASLKSTVYWNCKANASNPKVRLLELCDLGFWYLCVMMSSLITLAYPVVSRILVHVFTGKLFSILFAFLTQGVVSSLS